MVEELEGGRSAEAVGLVGLRPEPAGSLGHSATIPSAEVASVWRCAISTPCECVDRLRAKWSKRRQRSKVLQEFDAELDEMLDWLMDQRHLNAPKTYKQAFERHKQLNAAAASGIEARSDETLQAAQPVGQEPGPQGDAQ